MSRRARFTLAILFLVALVLDFLFFTGFFASDDLQYLTGARKIASLLSLQAPGEGVAGMGNSRLGVTVPSGVVYWISGGSIAAVAWFHVLYHLILVGLAFALGRLFHGERTGLIAAGIAATSPILYVFAGAILPDNVTAVWLALILILLELVRRREADGALPAARAFRWYFSIGLLFGVAYSSKDTALVMTVPAAACVMASAPRLKSPVWIRNGAFMLAGLIAFVLVELLALRLVMHEWVFRPSMVQEAAEGVFLERMQVQGSDPIARFWFALGDRLSSLAPITTWILLAGAVAYPFIRDRRLSLITFFWWPFVYLTIGTTSFSAYRPPTIQIRYYAIIIIPAAVMTAIAAQAVWARWRAWERVPAPLRGRPALAAVMVAALAVAWHELAADLPESGNIYKAPAVRGLAAAYEVARDQHPEYPILIGSHYGDRMKSLLAAGADERVYWAGAAATPEPPYLVVGLVGDGAAPTDPQLEVGLLDTVYPPASRFEAVKGDLARVFGLPPHPPPEADRVIAGTVELVSRTGAPDSQRRLASSWRSMPGSAPARRIENGAMLYWGNTREDSLRTDARHPLAQLGPDTRRVRVALGVRVLVGKKANVRLEALAYEAAGEVAARGEVRASLVAGAAPATLTVDLASSRPIASVQLRLKVAHRSADGALYIAHPRIAELP
jgi:4-amino-4-deoxy-L-arabinose transferase-like glycosyltransferase